MTGQPTLLDFDDAIDPRLRQMRIIYKPGKRPCGECDNYSGKFCYSYGPNAKDWPADAEGCGLWRARV